MANPFSWIAGKVKTVAGAPDLVSKVYNDVRDGIDALHTSDEERSKIQLDFINARIRWMEATMGQNPTRRALAMRISSIWMGSILVWAAIAVIHAFTGGAAWLASAAIIQDVVKTVTAPVWTILGFYFAVGGVAAGATKIIHARNGHQNGGK